MNDVIPGILVDLEELKKTSKIVLWGKIAHKNNTYTPNVKIAEIDVDWRWAAGKAGVFDTHLTFE